MARAYAELFSAHEFDLTTFPNDEGYDELVLARSIPLRAVCEHHLLPFIGVAHVGYLPGERILGLSKLARVVEPLRRPSAGPGAADHPGRRLAGGPARAPRRRRGHRGRAHVHDHARGTGQRGHHGDLDAARRAARRPAVAPGVLRAHQDRMAETWRAGDPDPDSIVIVGGGLAGAKTAEALREQGYDGPVTLLAAEDELPYERPPLSKGYLAGKDEFDEAVVHPEEWYAEHDVDLRRGTEVDRDRPRRRTRSSWPTAPGCRTARWCSPPAPSRAPCRSPAPTRR